MYTEMASDAFLTDDFRLSGFIERSSSDVWAFTILANQM